MRVAGAVALVTGGGSGLGAAVVEMLVAGGARVAVLDREPGSSGAHGDAAAFLRADVSDPDAVQAAVEGAVDRFGGLDVAVCCAGISPQAPTLDAAGEPHPLGLFRRAVDVNLVGLFDVVRHCAAAMARNAPGADGERGLIVNAASIAGIDGHAGQVAYSATKGAVVALTRPLALDLAPHGIRVVAIAPGMMDTPMLAGLDGAARDALVAHHLFPRRLGRGDEFAALVRFAMENTMLNGEVIRLDAGARLPNA
jgi:3-hydroxyacyl-CoA dehydrogenase/3-hydroxy-2-methylbutyryl-CoA dehydrogenase